MTNRGWMLSCACVLSVVAITQLGCKKARSRAREEAPTTEKASTVPGVSEDKVKVAMTAVFSGPNAGWGTEYYRGSLAYFSEVNSKGGVHGRQIVIAPKDDGYDPPRAAENVKQFLGENDTFAIYGAVGTKIVSDMVAPLMEREKDDWMQFGNHTGGQAFRDAPGMKQVFNVRPSYRQEARTLVEALTASGHKKIAVFHQDDPYGKSGLDGVTRALTAMNLAVVATATHPVGQKFDVSMTEQVKKLRDAGADAVICVVGYQAGAGFVRDARESGWNAPIANFSPVSDTFLRTLVAYEAKNKKTVTNHLLHSQVTPALDSDLPAVAEYRALMDKRNPQVPSELQDANYRLNRYGFSSLEGFLAAKTFVEVLQRTGPDLTRQKFHAAADALNGYDPGVGAQVSWNAQSHEGLNKVWTLGVKNGGFIGVANPAEYLATPTAATAKPAGTPATAHK